jgi:hypothetical protein
MDKMRKVKSGFGAMAIDTPELFLSNPIRNNAILVV